MLTRLKFRRNILVLGAGYVSKPAIDYLSGLPNTKLTIGTDKLTQISRDLVAGKPNVDLVQLDVLDSKTLDSRVKQSDVVLR